MKKITEKQKKNAFGLFDALAKSSITSPELWKAIECVAAKESGFIPRREKSYAKTSNERIRKIFGKKKIGPYYYQRDSSLSELKKNARDFFNIVYSEVAGNGEPHTGDGYNYRGGGYGQTTGLGNYRAAQNATGWALVDRPSLITIPECAADVLVSRFERALKGIADKRISAYYCKKTHGLTDAEFHVFAIAWINAGIGKKPDSPAVKRAYNNAFEWLPTVEKLYNEWSEKK